MIGSWPESSTDGARSGPQPGRDGGPAGRVGAGAAGDRRGRRVAVGRRVGAGDGSTGGTSLPGALACGRRRRRGVRARESRNLPCAPGEGLPGRVWQSWRAGLDPRRPRRRKLPAGCRGCGWPACTPAFSSPIRSASGVWGPSSSSPASRASSTPSCCATMASLGVRSARRCERRRDAEACASKEARHRAMLDAALDCVVDHRPRRAWSSTSTRPPSARSATPSTEAVGPRAWRS